MLKTPASIHDGHVVEEELEKERGRKTFLLIACKLCRRTPVTCKDLTHVRLSGSKPQTDSVFLSRAHALACATSSYKPYNVYVAIDYNFPMRKYRATDEIGSQNAEKRKTQ